MATRAEGSVSGLRAMLEPDLVRLGRRWSLGTAAALLILRREFRPVFTLRLCQSLIRTPIHVTWGFRVRRRLFGRAAQLLHAVATQLAGMDLHWDTSIGPGFMINHGWGLVISPRARIGANCTLFHGVTIGRSEHRGCDGHVVVTYPVIEDDVCIGPHAIVAGVRIGKGAGISAGTLVTRNVPPFTLVGGNPMVRLRRVPSGNRATAGEG